MNKKVYILTFSVFFFLQSRAQREVYDKQFFVNSMMSRNYFYSDVSYQSPSWIKNINHKLPVEEKIFFTPGNSLQLDYTSSEKGEWKADVLFHDVRGVDTFINATQLVFRLYIQSNTGKNSLPFIALVKDSNNISSLVPIQNYISTYINKQWIKVAIPLKDFGNKISFEDINAIQFKQQSSDNAQHIIYIDQLELLPEAISASHLVAPTIKTAKAYTKHVDITWNAVSDSTVKYIKVYRSDDGKNFSPVG